MMKLVGCGCPGFSYTQKYKKAIISLYDWVNSIEQSEEMDYGIFQERVAKAGVSDESEVRMLIPFFVKSGVIDEGHCIRGGSRIRKLIVEKELFTEEGSAFSQFLKIEMASENVEDNDIKKQIRKIYLDFALIQIEALKRCGDDIYNDLLVFLSKYKTMDKNEFFILTTMRHNNQMSMLGNIIGKYREGSLGELEITQNVQDYTYITGLLIQTGILEKKRHNKGVGFTKEYLEMKGV